MIQIGKQTLPIYRLTPLDETADSLLWRASTMRPQCLWIKSWDEYEARQAVAQATAVAWAAGGLSSPWRDKALVACEYDNDTDVPRGIIRVRKEAFHCQRAVAAQFAGWASGTC